MIEATAQRWNPSRAWVATLAPIVEVLERDPGPDTLRAWCDLAMTFGDTRAPALALVACLYAEATAAAGADLSRLRMHRNLCLLDLGIADGPAQVPIAQLGTVVSYSGLGRDAPPRLDAWLAGALAPFDGDLQRAAQYVLALAAARLGR